MNDSGRNAAAFATVAILMAAVSSALMLILPDDTVGVAFTAVFVAPVAISLALTVVATLRSPAWGLLAAVGVPLCYAGYGWLWLRAQSPTGGDGLDGLVYLLPAAVATATGATFLLTALVVWFRKAGEPATSR